LQLPSPSNAQEGTGFSGSCPKIRNTGLVSC
jgi:hypothetical protein